MRLLKNPLNFIRKANRSFNLYLADHAKLSNFLKDHSENQDELNTFLSAFMDVYGENQDKIDQFINRYQERQEKMDEFMDIFNRQYRNSKDYFYNGREDLFKNMDSDDFFQMCFFNNIKLISHSPSENRIYLKTEDGIKIATNNRFYTVKEIFGRGGYSVPQLHQFKEFIVFDVGMNRGYSALKFANFDSCKAVYGFEINEETYNFALENFNLNQSLYQKIKPHNFGLSQESGEVDIYYIPGSDGVTTTELDFTNIQSEWLRGKEYMKTKKAKVKEAGSVISDIIAQQETDCNLVLKIDTEGSEHKIIDSLISANVLDKMDLIMGEMHLGSLDLDQKMAGFKNIYKIHHSDTIYSFAYTKDEFYNQLSLREF